ncbi:hypothetical protein E3A20_21810 [Planctomyces bekefii]|uniref:Uncharacterized protein n=1 Tax=Planctomyces bekefii TaxID=1653850 RepID=A0A5C6M3Q8_9PLAN|nr:hypothetical protein E3A20_21810 [Planctomyces bekefii]
MILRASIRQHCAQPLRLRPFDTLYLNYIRSIRRVDQGRTPMETFAEGIALYQKFVHKGELLH